MSNSFDLSNFSKDYFCKENIDFTFITFGKNDLVHIWLIWQKVGRE